MFALGTGDVWFSLDVLATLIFHFLLRQTGFHSWWQSGQYNLDLEHSIIVVEARNSAI